MREHKPTLTLLNLTYEELSIFLEKKELSSFLLFGGTFISEKLQITGLCLLEIL